MNVTRRHVCISSVVIAAILVAAVGLVMVPTGDTIDESPGEDATAEHPPVILDNETDDDTSDETTTSDSDSNETEELEPAELDHHLNGSVHAGHNQTMGVTYEADDGFTFDDRSSNMERISEDYATFNGILTNPADEDVTITINVEFKDADREVVTTYEEAVLVPAGETVTVEETIEFDDYTDE